MLGELNKNKENQLVLRMSDNEALGRKFFVQLVLWMSWELEISLLLEV